jgi:hypothetical protein
VTSSLSSTNRLYSFATEAGQGYSNNSESDNNLGEVSLQFNDIEDAAKSFQEARKMSQDQLAGSAGLTARSLLSAVGEQAASELLPTSLDDAPMPSNGSNTQIFQVLDGINTPPPKKKKKSKAVE